MGPLAGPARAPHDEAARSHNAPSFSTSGTDWRGLVYLDIDLLKLCEDYKLLLAFDTFVPSEVTGHEISFRKIIHSDDHSALKVKTAGLSGEVRKRIARIAALVRKAVLSS
jgi:hypothetical protein